MTEPTAASVPPHAGADRTSSGRLGHLEESESSRALIGLVAGLTAARPATVLLGPATLEVSFAERRAARWPFEANEAGCWTIDRTALAAIPPPVSPPACALVTVARDPFSRALLDLFACGSVTLEGPPVAVGATLCDIVVELATRRWSDLGEVVVVGFGDDIAGIRGLVCLPSITAASEYLHAQPPAPRCFVIAPCSSPRRDRREEELSRLIALAGTSPETAVVSCEPDVHARVLWRLSSHQETLDVSRMSPGGRQLLFPVPPMSPVAREEVAPAEAVWALPPSPYPPGVRVVVRVLGHVDILGSATPLTRRPRVTELLAYLALHPDGCSGDAIAAAVWPRKRVPAQTLANRLSEARQALGLAADGSPRLQRREGRHVLTGDVVTDLATFQRRAAVGDRSSLEDSLRLVRGRPFEGLHDSGWTLLEGFVSDAESAIVATAERLCEACLSQGDPPGAIWAVQRGLLAAPWDEGLYRHLMRAYHAAGNTGGIETALKSLARALEWPGPPLDGVHPETARLYRSLLVRHDR